MSEEEYKEKSETHRLILDILFVIGIAMLVILGICIGVMFFVVFILVSFFAG